MKINRDVRKKKRQILFSFILINVITRSIFSIDTEIKVKSDQDLLKFTVTIFAYLSSKILSVKIKYFSTQRNTQPEDFYANVRVNKNILTPNIHTQSDCW